MTAPDQARKVVVTDYNFPALEAEAAAAEAAGAAFAHRQCKDAEEVGDLVEGASAVFVQFAPMDAAARVRERSNPTSVAVTVMMTNGVPSAAWAMTTPQ